MRKAVLKSSIIIFLALAVFTAVLCLALSHADVAIADGPAHFTILTPDGNTWELRHETATISYAYGNFFNFETPDDPMSPQNKFREEILHQLDLLGKGADEYELTFVLPKPEIYFLNGISSNPYTELDNSQIVVRTDYSDMLSTSEIVLEYRPKGDGAFTVFPTLDATNLRFGKGLAKGEYEVRICLTKSFDYFGRHYEPSTYSDPSNCFITESKIPDEDIEIPELPPFEYGLTLAQIAEKFSEWDGNGTWTVSAGQDASFVPPAAEAQRIVHFDFQPINTNYDKNENMLVSIVVEPRKIEVYIRDVHVLVGVLPIQTFEYNIESTLALDDTPESIGLFVAVQDLDINEAGTYAIRASVTSGNYVVVNRNFNDTIFMGGKYVVHSKGIVVHTADYRDVTFEREDGFIGYTITVTPLTRDEIEQILDGLEAVINTDGLTRTSAYVVQITDANGEEVFGLDGIRVKVGSNNSESAVAYYTHSGEWRFDKLGEDTGFELKEDARLFVLFKKTPAPYYRTEEWNAGLTATCVLIILFAVATWVCLIVYVTKRRLIK
ncbi:MAG: hypothetical protein J5713_02545 [Clostridia bacterium]|nr:hypothetical protein [Clostridia bacterium]